MKIGPLEIRLGSSPVPAGMLVRCPVCSSSRPAFRMMEASNAFLVGDRVVERITGYRFACQDCPAVYMVGPDGTYFPHADSLPPLRGFRASQPIGNSNGPKGDPTEMASLALPLTPKPRPKI